MAGWGSRFLASEVPEKNTTCQLEIIWPPFNGDHCTFFFFFKIKTNYCVLFCRVAHLFLANFLTQFVFVFCFLFTFPFEAEPQVLEALLKMHYFSVPMGYGAYRHSSFASLRICLSSFFDVHATPRGGCSSSSSRSCSSSSSSRSWSCSSSRACRADHHVNRKENSCRGASCWSLCILKEQQQQLIRDSLT